MISSQYVGLAVVVLGLLGGVSGEQHVLLDSTKESMLDWFKYPKGPSSPTPGWVEESFTNFEKGINWRSYVVCDVIYNNVNNWLWTPFIERGEANRIYIEIKFGLRNCNDFPGTALTCKATFSLLFYEFDTVSHQPPPWEPDAYNAIDRIGADEGRFTSNNEVIMNTETRSVEVSKKGIYFIFRDEGACLILFAIKVYYQTCPEIVNSFAVYPETPTGKSETSRVKKDGICVANSVSKSAGQEGPFSFCNSDGTWLDTQGGCMCMAGYESSRQTSQGQGCVECPIGKYKGGPGDGLCSICPPHSKTRFRGTVECRCNRGYYRGPEDDKEQGCTRPPSRPRNLTANKIDAYSVTLHWSPPLDTGSRQDTRYRIACISCGPGVRFTPDTETLVGTFVTVTGLQQQSSYRFEVHSENGVSAMARDKPQYAEISVVTEQAHSNDEDFVTAWKYFLYLIF